MVGYADPDNDDAYCVESDVLEYPTTDDAQDSRNDALHHADNVARICAEHEREYQEAHDALRQAREKLAEAMQCVVDCIGSLRDMASAGLVNANEWNSLCDQLAEYGEAFDQARDNALETLAKANRWYDIDWRDCAP